MELKICIPTHLRESVVEQKTIKYFPEELHENIYFFTCETRVQFLREVIPEKCNIIPVPKELGEMGIAGKRQFIVEWAYSNKFFKIWQLDDRLSLQENIGVYDSDRPTLKILEIKDTKRVIQFANEVEELLNDYTIVGNLNRAGTFMERRNEPPEKAKIHKENARVYTSLALRTDILVENDYRFDYLQKKFNNKSISLMEDYALLIQVIQGGHNTIQMGSFCFDKQSFSGKGGCANERDIDRQKLVCDSLHQAFPLYVKVVEARDDTKAKSVKWNVRISWKKLREDRTKNNLEDW